MEIKVNILEVDKEFLDEIERVHDEYEALMASGDPCAFCRAWTNDALCHLFTRKGMCRYKI